jgi:hypothetical protein
MARREVNSLWKKKIRRIIGVRMVYVLPLTISKKAVGFLEGVHSLIVCALSIIISLTSVNLLKQKRIN